MSAVVRGHGNGGASVTLSPRRQTAGPVQILALNLTSRAYILTVKGTTYRGRAVIEQSDRAMAPHASGNGSSATIRTTLPPGVYEVGVGSTSALPRAAKAASLTIEGKRHSSGLNRP